MGTAIIVAILIIIAIIAVKSYTKKLTSGCCGAGDKEKRPAVTDGISGNGGAFYLIAGGRSEISVSGMTCKHCKEHVENAFNAHDGVWATVDLKKGLADVRAKKAMTDFELRVRDVLRPECVRER